MAKSVFSVPIFFIAFRECLEASLIISILLGLVEQIVYKRDPRRRTPVDEDSSVGEEEKAGDHASDGDGSSPVEAALPAVTTTTTTTTSEGTIDQKALIRKLRIQIFAGALAGLLIALAIGAAFIAIWFTQSTNFWSKSEELWEGIFSLIASIIIFVMALTMLKLDQAKAKWKVKLQMAFQKHGLLHPEGSTVEERREVREAKTGRFVLFFLPMITVLREGLEAVIFIGGVALGQPATAIPLAAIVGLLCGALVGVILYLFGKKSGVKVFLVVMTGLLLLIGSGLFSKSVGDFEKNAFNHLLGADVDDAGGDGPGSFSVTGNVWHLDCCNPENNLDGQGWSIFAAIFGWTNSASLGTVLSYVFYWIAVVVGVIWMKWKEGRTKVLGRESARGRRRRVGKEGGATA